MDDTLCGVSDSVKMAWPFVDHSADQVMYISLCVGFLSVCPSVCLSVGVFKSYGRIYMQFFEKVIS